MLFQCTVLSFLACIFAGLVLGSSDVTHSSIAYTCAPTQLSICFINSIKLESPTVELHLENVKDKKTLSLKAGRIEALRLNHCKRLPKFEKLLIGKVGLKELCFATTFVYVSAEHNSIQKLHVDETETVAYALEDLRLNDNRLDSVESICNFHALKKLHLERNFLTTLNMACFVRMTQLSELLLANNRLNTITSSNSELSLPALSLLGLQNNTLIELDLHMWSLPQLEKLELSSNNLTKVRGLEKLQKLFEISLAGNRWQCTELDQMLEALEQSGVSPMDGDQDCSGIRNGTICCTYEQHDSEATLLDEMKKFNMLEQKYGEAETRFNEKIEYEIKQYESKLQTLKDTCAKGNQEGQEKLANSKEEPAKEEAPKCECTCSEESLKALEARLVTLDTNIKETDVQLQALLDNKSQLSYMTTLAKHEFRTAVKRGEEKLKELGSMLEMLRQHLNQAQKQH
uniref:Leucine rich immune protein (Short) n=1 Tax=Anopheles culicifacies TaxID=139723 RepID=A0A182LZ35_9DIPT